MPVPLAAWHFPCDAAHGKKNRCDNDQQQEHHDRPRQPAGSITCCMVWSNCSKPTIESQVIPDGAWPCSDSFRAGKLGMSGTIGFCTRSPLSFSIGAIGLLSSQQFRAQLPAAVRRTALRDAAADSIAAFPGGKQPAAGGPKWEPCRLASPDSNVIPFGEYANVCINARRGEQARRIGI